MQQMLRIQSVPIKIECKSKPASLQHTYAPPKVNVTRQKGGLEIDRKPAKVNIDCYEARASAGLKSVARSLQEYAQQGRQDAAAAARAYAEDGNAILDSRSKTAIADQAATKLPQPAETALTFIPTVGPEFSVDPGYLRMEFTPDQLTFDWDAPTKPEMEYIPGSIEFTITQYPEVIVEYLGSPIYAPPSADPNYTPPPGMDIDA